MRFLPLLLLISPLTAELTIQQKPSSIRIMKGNQLITEFHTDRQVPYLYPLVGPNGSSITRHFPLKNGIKGEAKDHPHHISTWFTHGSVNNHDFWHPNKDGPSSEIVFKAFENITANSFTAKLAWQHDGKTLLHETRTYQFSLDETQLTIDFTSRLNAQTEVTFGDTKEGSMAIRLTPSLRVKGRAARGQIENSAGHKNQQVWGKRAKWVSYHGPDSTGVDTVVTLMDHPKNLRHPTWWHARTYGLLAANPFGQHDFEDRKDQPKLGDYLLKKDTTLTQRYRLIIQKGSFQADYLNQQFSQFSSP